MKLLRGKSRYWVVLKTNKVFTPIKMKTKSKTKSNRAAGTSKWKLCRNRKKKGSKSVSQVINSIFPDYIGECIRKNPKIRPEDIMEKAREGTKTYREIEEYINHKIPFKNKFSEFKEAYDQLGKALATEQFAHDDKVHGIIDAIFSGGVTVDWKTCKKDDKDDGKIKLPLGLRNSEHSRYCLQMNL